MNVEYKIVSNSDIKEFEKEVNKRLTQGWELKGETFCSGYDHLIYNQVLIWMTKPNKR